MKIVKYSLAFVIVVFTLIGCTSVYTTKPIPDNNGKILRELPPFFNGVYVSNEQDKKLGTLSIEFKLINDKYCQVEAFKTFLPDELNNNDYYSLKGDFLKFENDSLMKRLEKLQKKEKSRLSYSEKNDLESLVEKKKKGELEWIKPVTLKDGLYYYEKFLAYEIDLGANKLTTYKEKGGSSESRIIFKQLKDYYIINVLDKENWQQLFFTHNNTNLTIKIINFSNLKDNQGYYKSFLDYNKIDKYDLIISIPDNNLLELLTNEEGFLKDFATYKAVAKSNNNYLYLGIALFAVILIIFVLRRFRSAKN